MYIELDKVLKSSIFEHPNMAKVDEAVQPRQPSDRGSMNITLASPTS